MISNLFLLVLRPISLCVVLLLGMSFSYAAIDVYQFDDEVQEQQFHELGKLLRCPKCQNQNIADSNAEIAKMLRQKTFEMTKQGKSKDEVVDYMVARFGDFVVYQPPVNMATIFLWLGPILLIVLGLVVLWRNTKKTNKSQLSKEDEQRLASVLSEFEEPTKKENKSS